MANETSETKIDGRFRDTRQRILREAEKLYYQGGYAGINLQELAQTVGISKAALFHHFDSKQTLFFSIQLEICRTQQIAIEEAISHGQNTRSRLRNIMVAMAQRPFYDPMKFLTDEYHQLSNEQQHAASEAFANSTRRPIERVIQEGMRSGELRPHNTKISVMAFLNMMMLLPTEGNPVTRQMLPTEQESYIDELLDLFLGGVSNDK